MRFQDKVALITAAASGIGRASADIIAREGGIVVAVDNNEERLDRTVAELREAGGRAHGQLCNALDPAEVERDRRLGRAGIRPRSTSWSTRSAAARSSRKPGADGRRAELCRLAEADRLQSDRHVPVHPCGRAGHEAAAARQDRQPGLDRRPRPQRVVVAAPMPRRRAASSPSPGSSPSSSGPTASTSTRSRRAAP